VYSQSFLGQSHRNIIFVRAVNAKSGHASGINTNVANLRSEVENLREINESNSFEEHRDYESNCLVETRSYCALSATPFVVGPKIHA
jgi:hypothetical protein